MSITITEEKFNNAFNIIESANRQQSSIGLLKEKTLHKILKYSFEPNDELHEVKIGRYHADILNENEIIEIQTRNFNAIRKKLSFLLDVKPVRVVYPLVNNKYQVWIDLQTGELTKRRKSPKVGRLLDCFYELYKIKSLLRDERLRFTIVVLDVLEYRNLDGYSENKRRGSSRNDRIPERLVDVIEINNIEDYKKILRESLPEPFNSKDIHKQCNVTLRIARTALNVLSHVDAVEKVGMQGNTILYKKL